MNGLSKVYLSFLSIIFIYSIDSSAQIRKIYLDNDSLNQINKISFYSPSSGFVAFQNWIGSTFDTGKTFSKKNIRVDNVDYNGNSVNLTFGFGINGVKSFGPDTIIVYGDYGLVPSILYSTNGGNNFKLIYYSQYNLTQLRTGITDIIFPENTAIGYAVDADRVLKTKDKGQTWVTIHEDAGSYFDNITAIDNNHVFAVSTNFKGNKIIKSSDGGISWQRVNIPKGQIIACNFSSANNGWINIKNNIQGDIYFTSDGGTSWTQMNDPAITSWSFYKMKFLDANIGFAIGDLFTIFKTINGGSTWEPLARDNNYNFYDYTHNDFQFLNASQFWAGGAHGFLEMTSNGGGTALPKAFFKIDTTGNAKTSLINLINSSNFNYSIKWYVNNQFVSNSYNCSYAHDIYTATDTIKLVVENNGVVDSSVKTQNFHAVPYPAPIVSSFSPSSGGSGTIVTISGNYFSSVKSVNFGGIDAITFKVVSLTTIIATVGDGANGTVSVTSATGTGFLPGFITVPPPVIQSFSPATGPIGSIVTINGSHFDSVSTNNIVYFGAVRSQVVSGTSNQLLVKVPAGANYQYITVTANKHIAYSVTPFIVTFPTQCGVTEYSFDTSRTFDYRYGSAFSGGGMEVKDLDGDGKPDIIVTQSDGISILRNTSVTGWITFATKVSFSTGVYPNAISIEDLDGDGKPDIVVANTNNNTISIFKNSSNPGSISFEPKVDILSGDAPIHIAINDLDGDGKPDMVVTNNDKSANYISIYRNISINGHINFMQRVQMAIGLFTRKVCIGDLDGDGKPDLFVANNGEQSSGANTFTLFRNLSTIGNITFGNKFPINHYTYSGSDAALADIDGDGKLDIVFVYNTQYTINNRETNVIFKNNSSIGSFNFANPIAYNACIPGSISFGDLDGDGKVDEFGSCWYFLFKNFSTPGNASLKFINNPYYNEDDFNNVLIVDIDSDGKPDIVTTENGASTLRVYRNMLNERGVLAGRDTTICNGQSLTLGFPHSLNGYSYNWSSDSLGFSSTLKNLIVSPAKSINYYISVTDQFGCVAHDTIKITTGGPAPIVNAGKYRNVCIGDSTQIGSLPVGSTTYSWSSLPYGYSSSSPNPIITPHLGTTNYILTANSGTCIAKDTVQINTWSLPTADAGMDKQICAGSNALIGPNFNKYDTISWTSNPVGFISNQQNPQVNPNVTTSYFLTLTNSVGCHARDTVTITVVKRPDANAGPDKTICPGDHLTIGNNTSDSLIYTWSSIPAGFNSNLKNPIVNPIVSTKYILAADNLTCIVRDTVLVNVKSINPPIVTISTPASSICVGSIVNFNSNVINPGPFPVYHWKINGLDAGTNSSNYSTNQLNNGDVVSMVLTNNNTCSDSIANSNKITISVNSQLHPGILVAGTSVLNKGQSTQLNAVSTNAGSLPVYEWQDSTGASGWQKISSGISATLLYTPVNNGSKIKCLLTSSQSCANPKTVSSNVLVFTLNTVTAIDPIPSGNSGIKYFPNPAHDILTLANLNPQDRWESLEIVDMNGKVELLLKGIKNQTSLNIKVNQLSNGFYIVKLYSKSGSQINIGFIKL